MKGVQKSQNLQTQQQSQVQTPKGSILSRVNNRIRSQNSNNSGILSQTDANFSEANSSVRYTGMKGVVAGQGNIGSGNLGIGMVNDGVHDALDISQISRISPQSSMVTIKTNVQPYNTERQQVSANQYIKHQQQSSQTSIGSINTLFLGQKKENIKEKEEPQQQHLKQDQQQDIKSENSKLQDQKLPQNNTNNANNKRMTFQPVILPSNNIVISQEKTNISGKESIKKLTNMPTIQSQGDSSTSQRTKNDIDFTNYVQGMQNAQTQRSPSDYNSKSLISNPQNDKMQKNKGVNNIKKNILPPSNQKQQVPTRQQQQTSKQLITLTNKQNLNSTLQSTSRNIKQQDEKNYQTTGCNNDKFFSEQQQIIQIKEQIRPDSQMSIISTTQNIQSQSVIVKQTPSLDKRLSNISQQNSNLNSAQNSQQKKLRVVVIQNNNNNINDKITPQNLTSSPDKDSKNNNTSINNQNNNKSQVQKVTIANFKNTQNNSVIGSSQQITPSQNVQQQPQFTTKKSIVGTSQQENHSQNKKPIFGRRQARNSSLDSNQDQNVDINGSQVPNLNQTQKVAAVSNGLNKAQSNKNEAQKQQIVKDQNNTTLTGDKQGMQLLTTQSNKSGQNTQETSTSQNTQNEKPQQPVEKKPIQKITKVVILPPSINKNEKQTTEKFNQTQRVTSQRKTLETQQDKRKSLGNDLNLNKFQSQMQVQQPTNLTNASPLKKQKTGGIFGARKSNQQVLEEEDSFSESPKNDYKTKTQEIINKNNDKILIQEQNSSKKFGSISKIDDCKSIMTSQLNKVPSQSSIVSFLNLEKEAQASQITNLYSINNQSQPSQTNVTPIQKQLIVAKGESRLSLDKNISIVKVDNKKQVQSQEKIELKTPTSKQQYNFNQALNHFKSASQVVQLTNIGSKKVIQPRDQKNISQQQQQNTTVSTNDNQSSINILSQKQQQSVQQKNMQILLQSQSNNTKNQQDKPKITVSSPQDGKQGQVEQLKLSPPNLAKLAHKQQSLNCDTDMREYNKIKNEINQFLKSNNILQYTDQDFKPDYIISYEGFRNLLQHLSFLDTDKVNPIQDYLIGQMWVKELQGTDSANLKNVITLLAGIMKIQVQEVLIQGDELNQFSKTFSVMMFSKIGQAKFQNKEAVESCANAYGMLSRHREELIVEKKNQESLDKKRTNQIQSNLLLQESSIRIEVGSLDNNKNQVVSKLMISRISPRSLDSNNSLQFSDLEKHSARSRVVMIPNKQTDEEIKLDLHNSNHKNSPLLDFLKTDSNSLTARDRPSNEQKAFQTITPQNKGLQSGNLLQVSNSKNSHQREKSKFGKITEEISPVGMDSGMTPRASRIINKLDTRNNNDKLSQSIAQHSSSDNIRSSLNFPAVIKKNNGKVAFAQGMNQMKGRKKIILDLTSPDQYLNQLEQIPVNPGFDKNKKMPVEEDSDKSKFGKLSDGSKLSEMIKSVGNKVSDDSDRNRRPLLFMDVNLGQQKGIQKLIVYENDSPKYLAQKFGELHDLKVKAVQQLKELISTKIQEALESRKNIRQRSKSPEIRSREPSPTDMTLKVVKRTQGVKVKSNTHGEVKIKREEDDEEEW